MIVKEYDAERKRNVESVWCDKCTAWLIAPFEQHHLDELTLCGRCYRIVVVSSAVLMEQGLNMSRPQEERHSALRDLHVL